LVGPGISSTGISPIAPINPLTGQATTQDLISSAISSGAAKTPSASDVPPVSQAAQTAPASSGANAKLNSGQAGSDIVGGAVDTSKNMPLGSISGLAPADIEGQKKIVNTFQDDVNTTANLGEGAAKLRNVIAQVSAIQKAAGASGWTGQIPAFVRQEILEKTGMALDPQASAQQAATALLKETLPGIIKQYNMTRFAKPEIQFSEGVVGNATMRPEVLNRILANLDAGAQLDMTNASLANQVRAGGYNIAGLGDYYGQKFANNSKIDEYVTNAGKDLQALQPSDVTNPTGAATPAMNPLAGIFSSLGSLFGGGGGGPAPATAAPPSPPQTPQAPSQAPQSPAPVAPDVQFVPLGGGRWGPIQQ
jgi:hypothetical protein